MSSQNVVSALIGSILTIGVAGGVWWYVTEELPRTERAKAPRGPAESLPPPAPDPCADARASAPQDPELGYWACVTGDNVLGGLMLERRRMVLALAGNSAFPEPAVRAGVLPVLASAVAADSVAEGVVLTWLRTAPEDVVNLAGIPGTIEALATSGVEVGPVQRVSRLVNRMRDHVAVPVEAVRLLGIAADAHRRLEKMDDRTLARRVKAASTSAWPRVELLLDAPKLGLDAVTPREAALYMDRLNALAPDQIAKEPFKGTGDRIREAILLGLTDEKWRALATTPPDGFPRRLPSKADAATDFRVDLVLRHGFVLCDETLPVERCIEATPTVWKADWVRTALLLDDRLAEAVLETPEIVDATCALVASASIQEQIRESRGIEDETVVFGCETPEGGDSAMLLLRTAIDAVFAESGERFDVAWELLLWHPELVMTLILSGSFEAVVTEGIKQDDSWKKVALLVGGGLATMEAIKGGAELDNWKRESWTGDDGRKIVASAGGVAMSFVPGVNLTRMLLNGEPTWGQLGEQALWDAASLIPASAVAKMGRAAAGAAKAASAAYKANRARKLGRVAYGIHIAKTAGKAGLDKGVKMAKRTLDVMKQLVTKKSAVGAATFGGVALAHADDALGKVVAKVAPPIMKAAARLAGSAPGKAVLRLAGSRPGHAMLCAGMAATPQAVNTAVGDGPSPRELGELGVDVAKCVAKARKGPGAMVSGLGKLANLPGGPTVIVRVVDLSASTLKVTTHRLMPNMVRGTVQRWLGRKAREAGTDYAVDKAKDAGVREIVTVFAD